MLAVGSQAHVHGSKGRGRSTCHSLWPERAPHFRIFSEAMIKMHLEMVTILEPTQTGPKIKQKAHLESPV